MSSRSDYKTVFEAFSDAVAHYPDQTFLHVAEPVAAAYGIAPGEQTYAQVFEHVESLKNAYRDAGFGAGKRIAIMVDNRPAFFYHWFALNALGVSLVPINSELTAEEQVYLLDLSDASLLVFAAEHADNAEAAVALLGRDLKTIDATARTFPPDEASHQDAELSETSECAILFTSGSTGQPKACLLSNAYFLDMGYWYRDIGGLCTLEQSAERLITPLPLTHMNAMATSAMAMVVTGGCLIQLDRFHPKSWWQTVRDTQATVVHYLGVMPAMLLQLPETADDRQTRVKFGFGAGVNAAHHAIFEQRFAFPLIEAWAMTETGSGGCVIANHEPRHIGTACFGKPDPAHMHYRLVDENGIDAEQGELLVRRAGSDVRKSFFSGYYKNDEATQEAWDGDWWHTGDVVRRNPDGTLSFVDRSKNIIRRSGENIAALEVEAVLSRHPALQIIAVAPVLDEIRGEEVFVCAILDEGFLPDEHTAQSVFEHCREHLAYFKTPGFIAFVDQLPLTATQKPKRNEIKQLCRDLLSAHEETTTGNSRVFDLRRMKKKVLA